MPNICLIHLVRESNGLQPLLSFLESYKKYPAGIDHDLLFLFKGFAEDQIPIEYSEILSPFLSRSLSISDHGFDIGAYFYAAKNISHKYLCFLNSYSTLLNEDWLAKMQRHITNESVGVVGASASYESIYPDHFPSPSQARFVLRRMLGNNLRRRPILKIRSQFNPFPNPHIRTNGFLVSRRLLLSLNTGPLSEKMDAHRFESGKKSLTCQIMGKDLKAVVVGRDGKAYEMEKWHSSHTFRSGEQRNLLIADNRTEQYSQADKDTKEMLSYLAWGNQIN